MQLTKKEKNNNKIGAIISISSHLILLFFFLFVVAWRAPNPPLPEIGIELNFGLDNEGEGEQQPASSIIASEETDLEEEPTSDALEEITEDVIEEDEIITEETPEVIAPPIDVVGKSMEEDALVANTQESSDLVSKNKIEEINKEKETNEEAKVKQVKTPKPPPILYPNNKIGAGGNKDGKSNKVQHANHGDKPNTVGNQGDKTGTVDTRALYSKVGGGEDGSSLHLSGWMWDFKPKPKDTSSESGRLVFQIVIDDKGNTIRVKTIESSVSPIVEKVYRDEIMKLTFSKTTGISAASSSTGTITFVIKAR